ncbi:serine/threonine-protein kinase mTOR-like isoform X2 [Babylonia areolata]|uniref:serine/threonine-protein kinase mTOR-like isoform X2 n=1 Tax=Babylonia areolata TaxID=304850 RepID=UPI003FD3A4FA
MTSSTQQMMHQFVAGLKNRSEEVRLKTAKDLYHFLANDLQELPQPDITLFLDEFNHHVFEMVSSTDINERKGGILTIVALISVDAGSVSTRLSRFANYLRNMFMPCGDAVVMEMTAKAMGVLALSSGTFAAEYVEFEVRRALEWLSNVERNEGRRHAAVLILKELAVNTPTFFFQQVQQFFDCIFTAVRDPKLIIRESAVEALRAALALTSQRETKNTQRTQWYRQCFDKAEEQVDEAQLKERKMTKDEWVHGSLLVINELLRCSNMEGERLRQEIEDVTAQQISHERSSKDWVTSNDMGSKMRSNGTVSALQQLQQKSSPLAIFSSGGKNSSHKAPVSESKCCRDLMQSNFDKVCNIMLRCRASRAFYVQQALLAALPRLAAFNPGVFSRAYLTETINFLLASLKRDRDRTQAFQAIGYLAISIQGEIFRHLPRVMEIIRTSLPPKDHSAKKTRNFVVDPSVFTCISMLARAMGPEMTANIKELLDSMFATGLSPALTAALRELAIQIPQLKKDIQDGLLKMLSYILMGHHLRHPGASAPSGNAGPAESHDVTSITLALRTLGNFDFEGHSLTQFVKHCAEHYLGSEHKEIRLEAVQTCARLLTPLLNLLATNQNQISVAAISTVGDVLGKLLVVGTTDSDPDIRYSVLMCLDERFDPHLAQAENLSTLFFTLHDEAFEIRERSICMIGRLSSKNPAYVLPTLRTLLLQYLTEIQYSGIGRSKEQATRMLGHLVANSSSLITPYVDPILKVLIPKLKDPDPNPGVTINVLACLGELAQVSGTALRDYTSQLLPLIIDMLQDSSSVQKREMALWSLGQLVESTGCVVEPYYKYPSLLEILLNFLKTEQGPTIRREVIRVLGLLGALDPHKHRITMGQDQASEAAVSKSEKKPEEGEFNMLEMLAGMGANSSLEEFYPQVAIAILMRIMRDPSQSQQHTMVVRAITFIFKSLQLKCVPYINQVIPAYLIVIRAADNNFKDFLFQQLGVIISIVKHHIKSYLEDIFELIKDFWTVQSNMQQTLILLVENIASALGTEFRMYLPHIMPMLLRVFTYDTSNDRVITIMTLSALQLFGANLSDYLHMLLPPLARLFEAPEVHFTARKVAIETIDRLTDSLDLTAFATTLIHPLVRVLDQSHSLQTVCMDTLSALAAQLGVRYNIFVPMVQNVTSRLRIQHTRYEILMTRLMQGTTVAEEEEIPVILRQAKMKRQAQKEREQQSEADATTISKLSVKIVNLHKSMSGGRRVSKEDWMEWLRKLSIELLKESPSPALRSCWHLAQSYTQVAKDLFNAAFVSCWTEMAEAEQDELTQMLEQALVSQEIPEVIQTLLKLAEFMEHTDKGPLPLDCKMLGERALKCRAYAKALHYKEEEFQAHPTTKTLEQLISINNKLQQPEAAAGALEYAQKHHRHDFKIQESWFEKLHEWDRALAAYEQKLEQNPEDMNLTLGKMRCLEAMGEWQALHQLAVDKWSTADSETRTSMARMASAASWGLGQWDSMEEYICYIPRTTYDGTFYRAVFALHMENFQQAQQCVDKARDIVDTDLTAMAGESYNRAYAVMVNVQMLSELEEIIKYKLVPERRGNIKEIWWERLKGCQRNVEDWQRILQVRSLVMNPAEDVHAWLKYASLCRKSGRLALSHKTLVHLLELDPSKKPGTPLPTTNPAITYAYLKHRWHVCRQRVGAQSVAEAHQTYQQLHHFVRQSLQTKALQIMGPDDSQQKKELSQLMARCYLRLGHWEEDLKGITESSIPTILEYYHLATQYDRNLYKAWHAWALMNYEAVLFYKDQNPNLPPSAHPSSADLQSYASRGDAPHSLSPRPESYSAKLQKFCVPSVHGFVRSISLSVENSLQDTLRLLTLMFDYGQWPDVYEALTEGIKSIHIDNWLQVIPQLIARIDTPRSLVGRLVHQLLVDISKAHPQALIYPLTVASKSTVTARLIAANKILKSMCERNANLVQQAMLVSEELIRVAILWHELWHEGLEDASRLYFGERNVKGMFMILEPLHSMVERGPQTLKETAFNQAYGRDLAEAQEWCRKYQRTSNVKDLTQAWDLYYHVFRRISKQLPQLTSLELQYVSPQLMDCRDLELAVPGTYEPNQPIICIQRVQAFLQVITSKQRPRKLSIFGSDGKEYQFLLKGHEDLRQDERVMQLFGLVNSLLRNNADTFRRNLTITRFAAIPLSTNSGLIGWVPHCDTLHSLIRDYRERKKILLNIEHRLMLRMAPDYDHLTLMQKVEVFEHALEHTHGDDLAKILWYKSPGSEEWFDRRTNYTRSLAVMSMVGYVLGLGDRHPSNLMLDRLSGKIIHIDFGDCFEVAMTRDKFPEKIPFRLTRMLIHAMEATGLDGNYRMTCEKVMEVLRQNKESLMAVLEAFVYDPLLNWRLVEDKKKEKGKRSGSYGESQEGGGDLVESLEGQSTEGHDLPADSVNIPTEVMNKKAVNIINRVRDKLTGRDFGTEDPVDVQRQVELLIQQATSHENLCQCYIGWCPFW